MSVSDYLQFEEGNPISDQFLGEYFQTLDLFGHFEKFRVRSDGTLWFTPTKIVPSTKMQPDVAAPELVKIEMPPVQVLLNDDIILTGDDCILIAKFVIGVLASVTHCQRLGKTDSDNVHAGSSFAEEIEKGIKESSFLAVLTD